MSGILERLRAGATTRSAAETQALAAELARALPADVTLALHGDLGVGKTTFVQGLARGLGVTEAITSPTFTVCNLYRGASWTLVHLDAYRLGSAAEMEALMIEDFLRSPYCVAIEWPSRVESWLPADAWHVELGIGADETHWVRLVSARQEAESERL